MAEKSKYEFRVELKVEIPAFCYEQARDLLSRIQWPGKVIKVSLQESGQGEVLKNIAG
jgi:hypothetical protein